MQEVGTVRDNSPTVAGRLDLKDELEGGERRPVVDDESETTDLRERRDYVGSGGR